MTDKAYAVPLHELLASVPRSARLEITDPDGMGTRFIPVGRYCHEAAEALRAALAQPESAECDGGQCGIGGYCKQCPKTQPEPVAWISHNAGLYHGKPDESLNPLPLYTAPPQREWVGLTDDEYFYLQMKIKTPMVSVGDYINAMKMVEEKLKDKNGF